MYKRNWFVKKIDGLYVLEDCGLWNDFNKEKYLWANSHLWSVSNFFFDFLGPNYGLFKKLEPEFGQNFRHDHNQPCTNWS